MTTSKPTIILIPGAWATPIHYEAIIAHLQTAGFPVRCLKLPSVNPSNPKELTLAGDVSFVRDSLVLPELEQGNNVILLAHSYGGAVAGGAAHGLGPADRGEGKPAVLGLIFIAALIAPSHEKIFPSKEMNPAWIVDHGDEKILTTKDAADVFFNNVNDPEAVKKAIEAIAVQGSLVFETESPAQAHQEKAFEGRLVYVKTHQDQSVEPPVQEWYLGRSAATWQIEDLKDSGHCPHMSHQGELVAIVEKYTKQWA